MLSAQKNSANDFPLYLFHQGKNFEAHQFSEHMHSGGDAAISTVFVSGHPERKVSLSSVLLTSGIAAAIL